MNTHPLPTLAGPRTSAARAEAERNAYVDLRRLASRLRSRERADLTLATTGLAHEAYLALNRGAAGGPVGGPDAPLGLYAHVMRNVLVSQARKRLADKRGGGTTALSLSELDAPDGAEWSENERRTHDRTDVRAAMDRLRRHDERLCRVVELKCSGGLEVPEIAAALGTSPATVKRDWEKARAFLQGCLAP